MSVATQKEQFQRGGAEQILKLTKQYEKKKSDLEVAAFVGDECRGRALLETGYGDLYPVIEMGAGGNVRG